MENEREMTGAAPQPAQPDAEPPLPADAPAAETQPAEEPAAVPADGGAWPLTVPDAAALDEEAELEKAMEQALLSGGAEEADAVSADGTPDLTGAFAHADRARFDARVLLVPVLGLIVIGVIVWALFARGNPEGKLVINEVMTSNQSTLTDAALGTPDWVELYNGSDADINVAGFGLSDSMKNSYRYRLPDVTIPAGGYLIVYFTGGTEAADQNPLCAGFGLSKDGDLLVLVDAQYGLLCEVSVPALDADAAYARRADGAYGVTYIPTPNAENVVPDA